MTSEQRFTSEMVYGILCDVINGDGKLPSATDPAIVELTFFLNAFRERVKGWLGPWRQEVKEQSNIAEAIWVLAEMLPSHREHYLADVAGAERWSNDLGFQALREQTKKNAPELVDSDWVKTTKDNLAAFDALVSAAQVARNRGLPLSFNLMTTARAPAPAIRWRDLAGDIERAFFSNLPDRSKASCYRFIAAVIPHITGETPTTGAVEISRKRSQ